MAQIKFTLKCPQCGSTKFKSSSGTPGPSDSVVCTQCGTTVNLATEKERLEKEARAAVEQRLRSDSAS